MPIRILAVLLSVVFLMACSSSEQAAKQRSVEETYAEAMAELKDEDWLEAQALFDIIKLQYPSSAYADDAQYYLAEINYAKGEYILAAFNYNLVRRTFPSSEFAKEALFKSALSYYELTLSADRDPEYTRKAIAAFADFQGIYPTDSLALRSAERITELRDRLAEKHLLNAQQYINMSTNRAALIYFDAVIEDYPDSKWLEDAFVGKLEILVKQKKGDDARATVAMYRRIVRDGRLRARIDELEKEIQ
ncbi:MAG: outer membrane protein assembly factor BamD [bacterium]|nr:outer membrane protein assembly factor BamD [bacterium]